jgi:hypothetical protein
VTGISILQRCRILPRVCHPSLSKEQEGQNSTTKNLNLISNCFSAAPSQRFHWMWPNLSTWQRSLTALLCLTGDTTITALSSPLCKCKSGYKKHLSDNLNYFSLEILKPFCSSTWNPTWNRCLTHTSYQWPLQLQGPFLLQMKLTLSHFLPQSYPNFFWNS